MPRPNISVPHPAGASSSTVENTYGKYALMILVIVIATSIAGSINLGATIAACGSIIALASFFLVKHWHPSKN